MRGRSGLANPSEVELTLQVTATVAEWRVIREALNRDIEACGSNTPGPLRHMRKMIVDMVVVAEKTYLAYPPEGEGGCGATN